MKKEHTKPPTLYTFRKDHKRYEDPEKGPPVRPLCDVSDSYGHKLLYFISRILKEISDEAPMTCDSTEDMVAAIKEGNNSGRMGAKTVIGSLDVKALYPSLDLDFTIEKVADEFLESEVKIDGVDDEELGLYLSLHRTEEQLREKGVLAFCPKRRNKRGAPPRITASGVKVKKEERFQPWIRPMERPDERSRRVMLREAMVIVLTVIMKNHVYNLNNILRRQKEGGAIGMDITGELAKVFMVWWDKEILKRMRSSAMDPALYKRYVDDINVAIDQVPEGTVYVDGSVVKPQESESTQIDPVQLESGTTSSEPDERTFAIVQEMGNDIHTSIQLTKDVPSANEDSKVPILDLKCWTSQMTTEEGAAKYQILHEFYMKEVSSKSLIHREAALAIQSKRTILTQECLRVLKNCHEGVGWERISSHLSFFMARMQASGYDKEFRLQVLKSALNAFEEKKEESRTSGIPLNRPRSWRRMERRREREEKKKTWFQKNGVESVMFVPATPNEELRKMLQEKVDQAGVRIKVVEKSGTKMVRLLQKNDPFQKRACRDAENCLVCNGGDEEEGGYCRESGVTYKVKCLAPSEEDPDQICGEPYNGETDRNGYSRGVEHAEDLNHEREHSVLWRHCVDKHGGVKQKFRMVIQDRSRNDPTKRQILEAVRIRRAGVNQILNGRSEWNGNRIPRLVPERRDQTETQRTRTNGDNRTGTEGDVRPQRTMTE